MPLVLVNFTHEVSARDLGVRFIPDFMPHPAAGPGSGKDYGLIHKEKLTLKHCHKHRDPGAYLIIVIFFTLTQFLENKIYTEKRQFFALNL